MKLNKNDYLSILDFYKIDYSKDKSFSNIKNLAEDIIAKKLCSCIKKVDPKNESKVQQSVELILFIKKVLKLIDLLVKKNLNYFFLKKQEISYIKNNLIF